MSDATTTVARLIARTEDARRALGMAEIRIERFPFSVGRERRTAGTEEVTFAERCTGVAPPLNDAGLVEVSQRHQVSREHFQIDFTQGKFVLTDRGSMCGTTVNGKTIGGQRRGGHTERHDQDEIVVGSAASPFVFDFRATVDPRTRRRHAVRRCPRCRADDRLPSDVRWYEWPLVWIAPVRPFQCPRCSRRYWSWRRRRRAAGDRSSRPPA